MIIELLHVPTKFRNTLIKSYFIDNKEAVSDSLVLTQLLKIEKPPMGSAFVETPQIETLPRNISLIKYAVKSPIAILVFLGLIKQNCEQPRKYLKLANITVLSDICFLIDKSVVFIKNINVLPAQYTVSREK